MRTDTVYPMSSGFATPCNLLGRKPASPRQSYCSQPRGHSWPPPFSNPSIVHGKRRRLWFATVCLPCPPHSVPTSPGAFRPLCNATQRNDAKHANGVFGLRGVSYSLGDMAVSIPLQAARSARLKHVLWIKAEPLHRLLPRVAKPRDLTRSCKKVKSHGTLQNKR